MCVFVLRPPTGAGFASLLYSRPPGVLFLILHDGALHTRCSPHPHAVMTVP